MRLKHLVLLLLFFISWPAVSIAANLGSVNGTVRDSDGTPIAKAKVTLLGRSDRQTDERVTGEDGTFAFEQIPFGQYRVVATSPDGRSDSRAVTVSSGEVTSVELFVAVALPEQVITLRPTAPAPPKISASESTVGREQIQELPRGESASVNEVLSTQPGFVYDALGNLYARGNHANIQYQLDGIPLPDSASGLFGGFLAPQLIENMEVITGGLGAEYGDRLAAVVNMNGRQPSEQGEGELSLTYGSYNTLNPSALYGRKVGKLSYTVGGSFKESTRALDPPVLSPILHDVGDEERAYARLVYDFDDRNHLTVLGTFAHNFYQIPLDPTAEPSPPPNQTDQFGNPPPPYLPLDTNETENERDFLALTSYRHDFGEESSLRVGFYFRHSYGFLFGDALHALGPTQVPGAMASDVGRLANHVGGTAEYMLKLGSSNILRMGGQFDELIGSTSYASYTRGSSPGPDPTQTVGGSDNATSSTGGIYLTDRASYGGFVVNAGFRTDFQNVAFRGTPDYSTQIGYGPRIGVAYSFTENTVVHCFFGLQWMPPPVLDTAAAARILNVATPGQTILYDLKPEHDRYAEIGFESRPIPQLSMKATAYGKLSVDQLDDTGVGNTNLVSPYNYREGRAGGIELGTVAVLSTKFSAFGNVVLSKAEGLGISSATYLFSSADVNNASWQVLDHSQLWTANVGANVHDRGTQLAVLVNYASGLRTGPRNDRTVPGHTVTDLTLSHQWDFGAFRPTLALDVVNLFDAHYAYRISNGFNGSHYGEGRSIYLRLNTAF